MVKIIQGQENNQDIQQKMKGRSDEYLVFLTVKLFRYTEGNTVLNVKLFGRNKCV